MGGLVAYVLASAFDPQTVLVVIEADPAVLQNYKNDSITATWY